MNFILTYQDKVPISDRMITSKAESIRFQLNIDENVCKLSNGWLEGFKKDMELNLEIYMGKVDQ